MLDRAMEKLPKKVESKDRFKIPEVVCETAGNKTVIKNFGELLSTLRRSERHLSKYLFKELATPGNIQDQTLVLQRKVLRQMIQNKIERYVKEFVYCKECGNPDTKFVKEDRIIFIKCEACGAKYPSRGI